MNEAKRNECMLDPLVVRLSDSVTLIRGDCRDVLPVECDAVVTDPPYGFGFYATDKAGGVVESLAWANRKAVFGFPETLCAWASAWGKPDEWVTWWPTNKPGARCKGLPREQEAIAVWGQLYEKPRRQRSANKANRAIAVLRGDDPDTCWDGDVWRDPSPNTCFQKNRRHPNEKPESLLVKLVRLTTQPGETVLDPYMGSGTTGIACIRTGRRFVGIEIDPAHFATARKRLENELRQGLLPLTHNAAGEPRGASPRSVPPAGSTRKENA